MSSSGPAQVINPNLQRVQETPSLDGAITSAGATSREVVFAVNSPKSDNVKDISHDRGALHYNIDQSNQLVKFVSAPHNLEVSLKYPEFDKPGDPPLIRTLQELLNASGLLKKPIPVDGHYREDTAKAVAAVQHALGSRKTTDGKEAGQQTMTGLIVAALENGKLQFTEEDLGQRWKEALPLLKVLVRPTPGELINNLRSEMGETQAEVKARIMSAQKILAQIGYDVGEPDGVIGKFYNDAIQDFMKRFGHDSPGHQVGAGTIRSLLNAALYVNTGVGRD